MENKPQKLKGLLAEVIDALFTLEYEHLVKDDEGHKENLKHIRGLMLICLIFR